MQRDNFECQLCHDKETSLNVHHKKYKKDKNPWESENDDLVTLCKHCHEIIEETKKHWEQERFDFEQIKVLAFFYENKKTSLYRYGNRGALLMIYEKGVSTGHTVISKEEIPSLIKFLTDNSSDTD